MRALYFLCLFVAFLISCGTHQAKKEMKQEFLTGAETTADTRTIKSALTVAGGPISNVVGATLQTETLIKSEQTALGKKNMETKENISKGIQSKINDLTKDKTCFEINIYVYGDIERAQFKNWRFRIEQSGNIVEALSRNIKGVTSIPKVHMVNPPLGTSWHNNTYACTESALSLDTSFKLHAIPQWSGAMNDGKPVTLEFKLGKQ